MKRCDVTGRIHRTARELTAELARIDAHLAAIRPIAEQFTTTYSNETLYPVPTAVGDAWNAVTDAIDALERERAQVEANPSPIPAGWAGTYALARQNID